MWGRDLTRGEVVRDTKPAGGSVTVQPNPEVSHQISSCTRPHLHTPAKTS